MIDKDSQRGLARLHVGQRAKLVRVQGRERDAVVSIHIEARPQAELLGRHAERAGHVLRGELALPVLRVLDGNTP